MTPRKRAFSFFIALACGLCVFALGFYLPLYALVPVALAALGVAFGPWAALVAALVGSLLCFAFQGVNALALAAFMPGGLLMPILMRKRSSTYTSVFLCASLTFISLWLAMVFFASPINAFFADTKADILALYARIYADDSLRLYFGSETLRTMRSLQLLLLEAAREVFAGAALGYSMISALISRLICYKIARSRDKTMKPYPKFSDWRLPDGFGFGSLVLFMASVMVESAYGAEYASLAYLLRVVVTVPFTVLGMCVMDYWLLQKRVHAGVRVTLNVVLALLLSLALTYCGLFEYTFALRQRTKLGTK